MNRISKPLAGAGPGGEWGRDAPIAEGAYPSPCPPPSCLAAMKGLEESRFRVHLLFSVPRYAAFAQWAPIPTPSAFAFDSIHSRLFFVWGLPGRAKMSSPSLAIKPGRKGRRHPCACAETRKRKYTSAYAVRIRVWLGGMGRDQLYWTDRQTD